MRSAKEIQQSDRKGKGNGMRGQYMPKEVLGTELGGGARPEGRDKVADSVL